MDERIKKLSKTIVDYSVKIKENDKVLIQYESSECKPLVKCLVNDIIEHKAIVSTKLIDLELNSMILGRMNSEAIDFSVKQKEFEVDNYDEIIYKFIKENQLDFEKIIKYARETNNKKILEKLYLIAR